MKRILTLLLCIASLSALASMVILFDPITGRSLQRIDSADTLAYLGKSNALINPTLPTNNLALCKVTNGAVVLLSSNELFADRLALTNARALADATWRSNMISTASAYMYGTNAEGRILRAFALLTLDQINISRTHQGLGIITTNTFLTAMSNAVTGDTR